MTGHATMLPIRCSQSPPVKKIRERLMSIIKRYGPLEISGFITAIIASWVASKLGAPRTAIAIAGTLGENVGYYGLAVCNDYLKLRRTQEQRPGLRRCLRLVGGLMREFGPAEVLDTLLIRPACMYAWGTATGKFIADGIFYAIVFATWLTFRSYRRYLSQKRPQTPEETETVKTPYLLIDLDVVTERSRLFQTVFPDVNLRYAMKCNPHPRLLRHINDLGIGFEIASAEELLPLIELGVDPAEVLFSNPAKSQSDIDRAYELGVRKFSFDSHCELQKLSKHPGVMVYLRIQTTTAGSDVPSEGKFGVPLHHPSGNDALGLLRSARDLGLNTWGISFHVGSQMTKTQPWTNVIGQIAKFLQVLQNEHGILLSMINIGGGFPAYYGQTIPPLTTYGRDITEALKQLPYTMDVYCEPGRGLVADAGVMVTTVTTIAQRGNITYVHLDAGAFNGFMESLETDCGLQFPVSDSHNSPEKMIVRLTGPSCDSQDTILRAALVSRDLAVGSQVYIQTAGAYTVSYASRFNGFEIPEICYVRHR